MTHTQVDTLLSTDKPESTTDAEHHIQQQIKLQLSGDANSRVRRALLDKTVAQTNIDSSVFCVAGMETWE